MWFENYELILFDFDGLLVDTEGLHFLAYQKMCSQRGYTLKWNFDQFCKIAHLSSSGLKEAIYKEFPSLLRETPSWDTLYREKKQAYEDLLLQGNLSLMPGVFALLEELQKKNISRAVVTNSARIQIERIQEQLPILKSIPVWITREDYALAKPAPDGYLCALKHFNVRPERVIGFEDSFRGLKALYAADIKGVLICHPDHPQLGDCKEFNAPFFSSFLEIPPDKL